MGSIIWSFTNGGSEITDNIDHGAAANGNSTTEQELFIRHTYTNPITNCALYVRAVTGTYTGSRSAALDYNEIVNWGNQSDADDFGGLMVNMDAVNSYAASWPTVTTPSSSSVYVVKSGVGDAVGNAQDLVTATGTTATGKIPNGSAPNVRFKVRFDIPTNEDTVGIRQIEHVLKYNYTS